MITHGYIIGGVQSSGTDQRIAKRLTTALNKIAVELSHISYAKIIRNCLENLGDTDSGSKETKVAYASGMQPTKN